jgi:branched-chain amino acid transport system substrate-binding protein
VIYQNNDFGKGGRDTMVKNCWKARHENHLRHLHRATAARLFCRRDQVPSRPMPDALFVYVTEEESARVLRELRKQGYEQPDDWRDTC